MSWRPGRVLAASSILREDDVQYSATVFLFGLLVIGAITDVTLRRIPNLLVCGIAFAASVHVLSIDRPSQALMQIALALTVGAVLTVPWRARLVGGGDVKLMTATSVWLRPSQLVVFLGATAIAGGVVSLAAYAAALAHRPTASDAAHSTAARARAALHGKIPYGIAIAAGGMIAVLAGR